MKSRILVLFFQGLVLGSAFPANATFHLMQVQQVIGGVNNDATAQAIQLRMRSSHQNLVSNATIRAWDATGSNPVQIISFPSDVLNEGTGVTILITTTNFDGVTSPTATADFTMSNAIPASYLAAGSLTFESKVGSIVYWRLSWGGASYTGPTTGATTNDFDGEFGPAFPGALATDADRALLFQGSASAMSADNTSDYALTAGAAQFTNNDGQSFTVLVPTDAPPDYASYQLRNRPNPFNPTTEIVFSAARTEHLTLQLYDPRGRLVTTLLQGRVEEGKHRVTWDGTDSKGRHLASGVYLARLRGAHHLEMHKLVLGK